MYLVHTFHVFAGVSLADLASGNAGRLGTEDAVPARLKTCVLRTLSHSLSGYRSFYLPNQAAQQQQQQQQQVGDGVPVSSELAGMHICSVEHVSCLRGLDGRQSQSYAGVRYCR